MHWLLSSQMMQHITNTRASSWCHPWSIRSTCSHHTAGDAANPQGLSHLILIKIGAQASMLVGEELK